jgi:hypothetical protein
MPKAMQKGLRDKVLQRDNYKCVRWKEQTCKGRMDTMEHPFGRKYERFWSTLTMCAYHAGVDEYYNKAGFNKEINKAYAYLNATDEDLREFKLYPQMKREKQYLLDKYELWTNT